MTDVEGKSGERGWYEYQCVVCGRLNCSSTIYFGYDYDGGSHCGQPFKKVRWVPINACSCVSPSPPVTRPRGEKT